ncbi:MAG: hypothetical protein AAGK33_09585 [Pseudomonadota bacterium]
MSKVMRKAMGWWRWGLASLAALAVAGVLAIGFTYPAIAAGLCASCLGMERIAPRVSVEPAMSAAGRKRLLAHVAQARSKVAAVWGAQPPAVRWVACVSINCDRRLGGLGASAVTLSTPLGSTVHLSPGGLNATIMAHELAHATLHGMVGVRRQMSGDLPAWMDEGMAVLVSGDRRFLDENDTPLNCLHLPDALPRSPFVWGPASGKNTDLYRQAACRVFSYQKPVARLAQKLADGWSPE